jgi:hypothetical protein
MRKPQNIITRSVSFEVALFETGGDQRAKNTGIIITRRVSEGFLGKTVRTQKLNPSLTFRVGISMHEAVSSRSRTERTIAACDIVQCHHVAAGEKTQVFCAISHGESVA